MAYKRWRIDKLTSNTTISRAEYTSILTMSNLEYKNAKFHQAVFVLSSSKILFDVFIDGISVFSAPFDLEEISNTSKYGMSGQTGNPFLWEYRTNKFIFKPSVPLRFDLSLEIKMKSNHASQQYVLELGYVEWGET